MIALAAQLRMLVASVASSCQSDWALPGRQSDRLCPREAHNRLIGWLMLPLLAAILIGLGAGSLGLANRDIVQARTADKTVTITWLCWGTPDVADRNQRIVQAFYRRYPDAGIQVKVAVLGWNDYLQKVPVMVAGGSDVDVIAVEGTFMLPALAKGDALLDVSDITNKYRGEFSPGALDLLTRDGQTLGVPMMGWESAPSLFILYNQGMLDAAGLVAPSYDWTWDSLISMGKKLSRGDSSSGQQRWALDWGQTTFPWYWENAIHAFGGWMYSPDHTQSEVNSPAAVAGITLLHDLRARYHISAPPGDWRAFDDGRSAMTARWDTDAQKLIDSSPFPVGVAIFPRGPAGNGFIAPARAVRNGGAPHSMAIYRFSRHPQEAKKFLDFVIGDPMALKAEGSNWPWVPLRRNIPVLIEQMRASASWVKVFGAISAVQQRLMLVDRAEGPGPEYQEVNQIMVANLQDLYQGKTSAQAAMDNAKRQIDAVLARQTRGTR